MKKSDLAKYWSFEKLGTNYFVDQQGRTIRVIDFGVWKNDLELFECAKIFHDGLIFVGNIRIVEGEFTLCQVEKNSILYLVFGKSTSFDKYFVLDLEKYIPRKEKEYLFEQSKEINIENHEELFLKRLESFYHELKIALEIEKNDYQAVLFQKIAYAFGLKKNALVFEELAKDIGFSIVRKCATKQETLEALFYGKSGLLEDEILDDQAREWKKEYVFLKNKYSLSERFYKPKFTGIRPYNYPTIRLSQFAGLYSKTQSLFSTVVQKEQSVLEFKNFLSSVSASSYWDNRFVFGKLSSQRKSKQMSENFINLLLINVVFPFRWSYFKMMGEDVSKEIILNYQSLPEERNAWIDELKSLGFKINNAFESQVYLYQRKKNNI